MPPYDVFVKTLSIVDQFLDRGDDQVSVKWDMFQLGKEVKGQPKKPIGVPGQVLLQTGAV